MASTLIASLLPVSAIESVFLILILVSNSFLFLVAMPGAPSSVFAPSSDARSASLSFYQKLYPEHPLIQSLPFTRTSIVLLRILHHIEHTSTKFKNARLSFRVPRLTPLGSPPGRNAFLALAAARERVRHLHLSAVGGARCAGNWENKAPSSYLFLGVRPGAPGSVPVPSSDARSP